jgi:hypothetical protein
MLSGHDFARFRRNFSHARSIRTRGKICCGIARTSVSCPVHTTRTYRIDLDRFAGAGKDVATFDRTVLIQYVEHLFAAA